MNDFLVKLNEKTYIDPRDVSAIYQFKTGDSQLRCIVVDGREIVTDMTFEELDKKIGLPK